MDTHKKPRLLIVLGIIILILVYAIPFIFLFDLENATTSLMNLEFNKNILTSKKYPLGLDDSDPSQQFFLFPRELEGCKSNRSLRYF